MRVFGDLMMVVMMKMVVMLVMMLVMMLLLMKMMLKLITSRQERQTRAAAKRSQNCKFSKT